MRLAQAQAAGAAQEQREPAAAAVAHHQVGEPVAEEVAREPDRGRSPPAANVCATPFGPITEIVFDPAFSVAMPGARAVEVAQEQPAGGLANGVGRALVVEESAADPGEYLDVVGLLVGHREVELAVPRRSPTATATGPASVLIRGPGISVQLDPVPWPRRIDTSLEPELATIRSGWPLRLATAIPAGWSR